ncbi:MAG TPA: CHAT domain-containing protein, partial [Streptomyces sp.]|nr:CHAT domain-containing protein [Streptomyces sp.]
RHEDRFHRTKDPDDLDLALRAMGEAGEYAARSGARLRALSWGMETGRLYAVRFGLLGGWEDQLHAVASMRMVIAQLPPGHPALVGDLLQLGVTLEGGHEYMFDTYGPRCGTEVIDEAVAALRRAWLMVEAGVVPPEDEDLPGTVLTMLGHCLLKRALAQREADAGDRDLDEAVRLLDRATALLGDGGDGPDRMLAGGRGTPGRAQVASLLRMYRVQAGLLRAMADGDLTALKEVIATARRRLETAGSPEARPQWQVILGGAQVFADLLAGRAAPDPPEPAPPGGDRGVAAAGGTPPPGTGDPSAAAMLAEAARGGTGSEGPRRALRYARLAATVALRQHRWAEAAELLGEALRQIHAQPSYGIPESARRAWLGQGRDFAGDLVTCLVSLGRTQEAVVAFEEHRAVLLSEVLGERADTVGLERVAPGPARDHRAAVRELRRFDTGDDARRPQHLAGRRRLIEERERVAERIRRIEGFERFGRPPRFADLVTDGHGGAAEGPVVLVNTGSLRSDALLLQDGEVRVVALPEARGDRLESATGALHRALNAAEEARADGDGPAYLRQQRAVGEVLEQLWDRVAAPVWEQVGAGWAPGDPPRRIWWVPSGPLWFLPLHTASAPGGPSLADLAVSSYVPTVRMLHLGRRRAPGRLHGPLVIGVPDAPGAAPLPGAEAEARLVASLTPGARLLTGPAATREAVLGALGRHRWLHFAGHGINTDDGTLLLLDGAGGQSLTTRDVLGRDLPGGDLAYLSACEAAQTSVLLPDEATHFGAALSVAGYRHVIGTLWRVDDGVAAEAARRFYGHLAPTATGTGTGTDIGIGTGTGPGTTTDARTGAGARSGADPALALHLTVRELRAAYPSMPGLWAAHLHIGP